MLLGRENKGGAAADFVFWRKLGNARWLPVAFLCQAAGKLPMGQDPHGLTVSSSPLHPGKPPGPPLLPGKGFSDHLPPRWSLPDGTHPPLQHHGNVHDSAASRQLSREREWPLAPGMRSPQPARGRMNTSVPWFPLRESQSEYLWNK